MASSVLSNKRILFPVVLGVVALLGWYAWTQYAEQGPGEGFISGNGRIEATEIGRQLEDNHQLMMMLGFRGTPGIVVKDGEGLISKHNGMPRPEALADIMGPR